MGSNLLLKFDYKTRTFHGVITDPVTKSITGLFLYDFYTWIFIETQKMLYQIKQSMSRRGNCRDNSPIERFLEVINLNGCQL